MERVSSDIGSAGAEKRRTRRTLLTATGAWAFGGAASAFFVFACSDSFLPLDWVARGIWTLIGVGLLASWACLAWAHAGRREILAAGGFVACVLACSPILWPYLATSGKWAKIRLDFARDRSQYEWIVAQLGKRPDQTSGRSEMDGVCYELEPGPPLRVAFPLPGGILDNWTAIVYDSSEEGPRKAPVGRHLSRWDDPDLKEVRMWFGGEMRHARRLGGGFFYCIFT